MACDSLYAAWLKAHYPFEMYATMLKLYTEKSDKNKIAALISEMNRYKCIHLRTGRFGQDNRDWFIDKENKTISQSLSSIKFISAQAAEDLYEAGKFEFESFIDLLRYLQTNTCLNSRQTSVLIKVNYFERFGKAKKLLALHEEFLKGKNKVTKTLVEKTVEKRMDALKTLEAETDDESLPICEVLSIENEMIGLCLTSDQEAPDNLFFVLDVDVKYGAKIKLYNVKRGTSGIVRVQKRLLEQYPFEAGQCLMLDAGSNRPKSVYKDGKRIPLPNEREYWMTCYHLAR